MGKVLGNTSSVRHGLLEYLESFIGETYSPGEFLPAEIKEMMFLATCATGVEIAVFLDRKNRVEAVCIGESDNVSLEGFQDTRRGEKRLSGIRLWHTHPNGTPTPSDVDISALQNSRLDACGVLGVNVEDEKIIGASATLLKRDENGNLTEHEVHGPVRERDIRSLDALFGELIKIDREAGNFLTESLETEREKAILCGVLLPEDEKSVPNDGPLAELAELADTAGAVVVASYSQKRPNPDSKYYIGKGLAEEIALRRQALNATLLIVDDELTAGTVRNLEDITGMRVVDRTMLILDIFAARAKSKEGRLQVELAQQKYRLPRLMGLGTSLSRLGGGIGTRGPGESKLTSDRNHIKRRILYLEEELRKVETSRNTIRKERKKNNVPQIAVVGYTNAGKSTLVNTLCNADVFAENMLFATLDTSVRKLVTEENKDILLIDTVGFIRKLPHELVEAFKSTLEELKYADFLLQVVDGSSPDAATHIEVVNTLIKELGAGDKPMILCYNKLDLMENKENLSPSQNTFYVSSKTGENLGDLKNALISFFKPSEIEFTMMIPYTAGKVSSYLHDNATLTSQEYVAEGLLVTGKIDEKLWKQEMFESYIINSTKEENDNEN